MISRCCFFSALGLLLPLLSHSWVLPQKALAKTAVPSLAVSPNLSPSDAGASPPQDNDRLEYSWKNQWYALTYESYVPNPSQSSEVTPAAVFGEPLVLWREQDNGEIYCAADQCPHRAAALSEGRLRDGQLYCLYHGWQFSGQDDGACTRIPQLDPAAVIPQRACLDMKTCRVDEGMVWVWMGSSSGSSAPPTRDVPRTGVVGTRGWTVYDFMIDLPYDHSFLVENLLDPAHIAISHDRTPGGGKREDAAAYDMQVDTIHEQGFSGKFRLSTKAPDGPFANFTFEAPGIVRNEVRGRLKNGKEFAFGAGLHCMPLALGRSRLFFRIYNTGLPKLATFLLNLKPTWLRHLNSCKVLEQDVGLITTQEDHFARRPEHTLADDYLLLKTSDTYVKAYRQWLDRVGHGMPWFQGLATQSARSPYAHVASSTVLPPGVAAAQHRASNQEVVETRYHRHVMHSPVTRKALQNVKRCKRAGLCIAGISLTTVCALVLPVLQAATTNGTSKTTTLCLRAFRAAVRAFPIGTVLATAMHFLEKEFHVSFKRKNQLRGESGLVP